MISIISKISMDDYYKFVSIIGILIGLYSAMNDAKCVKSEGISITTYYCYIYKNCTTAFVLCTTND